MKKCSKCKVLKKNSDYFKEKRHTDGLRSDCKKCTTATLKKWMFKNHITQRGYKYEISEAGIEKLKLKQKNVCAICKEKPINNRELCVDHCHKTNIVRGLLCIRCNAGLGFFKDNVEYLKNAICYLNN